MKCFWNKYLDRWIQRPVLYSIQVEEILPYLQEPHHWYEDYMYVGVVPFQVVEKEKDGKFRWMEIGEIMRNPKKYPVFSKMLKTLAKLNTLLPPKREGIPQRLSSETIVVLG